MLTWVCEVYLRSDKNILCAIQKPFCKIKVVKGSIETIWLQRNQKNYLSPELN